MVQNQIEMTHAPKIKRHSIFFLFRHERTGVEVNGPHNETTETDLNTIRDTYEERFPTIHDYQNLQHYKKDAKRRYLN